MPINNTFFEDLPPDPSSTIEALKAIGYSLEAAIADLVDNAIDAKSSEIDIEMRWNRGSPFILIRDNGRGMSSSKLTEAMRIGSNRHVRGGSDGELGKFGFGLKTASFSQCSLMSVLTKSARSDQLQSRYWDLDQVIATGRWVCPTELLPSTAAILQPRLGFTHGTIVVWERLDETFIVSSTTKPSRNFDLLTAKVFDHLALVFHRFLSRENQPISIRVNDKSVKPWNPFPDHVASQQLPALVLKDGSSEIVVSPYVMPHKSKLTEDEFKNIGGQYGWNSNQGFYVYREDRLVVHGVWFDKRHKRDSSYDLARVKIDLPRASDGSWSLSIAKNQVSPPARLEKELRQVAEIVRQKSEKIYKSRGVGVRRPTRTRDFEPLWRQVKVHGEVRTSFNRNHRAVKSILQDPNTNAVKSFLVLVEASLRFWGSPPTENSTQENVDLNAAQFNELVKTGKAIYDQIVKTEFGTPAKGRSLLESLEPFNHYPEILDEIFK